MIEADNTTTRSRVRMDPITTLPAESSKFKLEVEVEAEDDHGNQVLRGKRGNYPKAGFLQDPSLSHHDSMIRLL